jgi:GH25 family lysozyme M1 (1,4-beta-N-acetylmuramidase)
MSDQGYITGYNQGKPIYHPWPSTPAEQAAFSAPASQGVVIGKATVPKTGVSAEPTAQPSSTQPYTEGLDLSAWQSGYNPLTAQQKPGFVILKASEGTAQDPNFNSFYNSAVGVVPQIGAFHYLRSDVDTNAQVNTTLQATAGKSINFYAVDVEGTGNSINQDFANQAIDYATKLQDITGKTVYLYTGQSLYDQYFSTSNIPLWLAAPSGVEQNFPGTPTIVQTSFAAPAKEFGVTGSQGVDEDIYPGTPAQLAQSIQTGQPAPNTKEQLASLPYQGLGGTYESAPASVLGGSLPSTPTYPENETTPFASGATGTSGASVSPVSSPTAAPTSTVAPASYSILPQGVTDDLNKIANFTINWTNVTWAVIGFVLFIIGLIMLFSGQSEQPAQPSTGEKLSQGT